jgi:trimeric autotransporter adhesin
MATLDSQVADLTTATTALLQAVNVQKAVLDAAAATATAQATAATGGATTVTTSLAQAVAARDQAVAAWNASTAPAETLATISQSIHSGSIARTVVYDTSRDSDGGAWRKRTAHTSWYNEPLNGVWRGQRANEAACRAVAGAATGDYYQNTTDGLFYSLNAGNGQTAVARGNTREFPAVAALVLEVGRLVIYDLTQPSAPMWMVFNKGTASWTTGNMGIVDLNATSVAMLNGELLIASNSTGLSRINLLRDSGQVVASANSGGSYQGNISQRNLGRGFSNDVPVTGRFFNGYVNDVAVAALSGAPIDPSTGLPAPTIAVATAAGLSVIPNNGSVVTSANTGNSFSAAYIHPAGSQLVAVYGNAAVAIHDHVGRLGASFAPLWTSHSASGYSSGNLQLNAGPTKAAYEAYGGALGLSKVKHGASPASSMTAFITKDFNSTWMQGDSRGCWMADTVAGAVAGGEMVINGNFTTDTSNWAPFSGGTPSVVSGALRITNDGTGTNRGSVQQALATVPGQSYNISITPAGGSSGNNVYFSLGSVSTVGNLLDGFPATATTTFTATTATTYLILSNRLTTAGAYCDVDNVSCKPAVADRSVKNNGLSIVGTLTKVAAATGTQICLWTGFSASNYGEQTYSANLDFGTTPFAGSFWLKVPDLGGVNAYIFRRDSLATAQAIKMFVVGGMLRFELFDGTTTRAATGTTRVDDGVLRHVAFDYSGGTLNVYVNDVLYATATGAPLASLSNAAAVLRIGYSTLNEFPLTGGALALLKLSATVPSADQRAQIYRDELALMQPGVQCTMAGTSSAVTALAYDEATETLHVGANWGRSAFRGLVRYDSEATAVGSITALSSSQGAIVQAGTSGGRFYQPALTLRDELRRRTDAARALGSAPQFFDYDAIAAQTTFAAPKGYTIKAVYLAGALKRMGATKDYTVSFDGYVESATFGVAPGASAWVSLMCVRS